MQDIKNALIKKLSLFTPEYPVYDEEVEQGMQQPCFLCCYWKVVRSEGLTGAINVSIPLTFITSRNRNQRLPEKNAS